jgi:hypothetical protein
MSGVDYEHEVQKRLIARYGAGYGVTPELVDRIQNGTASAADRAFYAENAARLTDRFRSDLATMSMNAIRQADAELAVGLLAATHRTFGKDETYSKVMTPDGVRRMLAGDLPAMQGFIALSRFTDRLSPQQIITQLGLSYRYDGATPFLVKDDGGALKPQSFVYSLEAPITGEIREKARIPVDPRLLAAARQIAGDPARGPGDLLKRAAQEIANPAVCCVVVREDGTDTRALVDGFAGDGFAVYKPVGGPSTGSSVPRYGTFGDIKEGYADTFQERMLGASPVPCPPGTAIYIKVPGPGAPGAPNVPEGSIRVKLYEWNGRSWERVATDEQSAAATEQACAGVPVVVQAEQEKRLLKPAALQQAHAAAREKESLDMPLPEVVRKKMDGEVAEGKKDILKALRVDATVAMAAVKLKKKPQAKAKKLKAQKDLDAATTAAMAAARLKKKKQQEQQKEAEQRDEPQKRSSPGASEGGDAD